MAPARRLPSVVLTVLLGAGVLLARQPAPAPVPAVAPERVTFDTWLDGQARQALDARRARVATLVTRADVEARQRDVRTALRASLGLLPAVSTPLGARVTRTTARQGYRIEHVVFESAPGFRVTANAYVPEGTGPFPAVVGTAGHADEGKASPVYQHAWVSLARRGFLVLAIDPFGQGERLEYPDAAGTGSRVGIGTREHSMTGQQVLLTGRTLGAYMVRDMQRALDYLASRPDVDAARLAVAGNSGGGTQAALLGAVEPRLAAVVVSCYMTSWADMWDVPGPQDAEQILPGFVGLGLDFADFALAAAPRGFLVSSAIKDFFPIAGSRAASAELTRLYDLLGAGDRLARVENDATHGWTQPLREGAYQALGRWLGRPGPSAEAAVTTEPETALRVTTTGQLATSGGSHTVRQLNAEEARTLARTRPAVTDDALRRLLHLYRTGPHGRIAERSGSATTMAGERLAIELYDGLRLPARFRASTTPSRRVVLLLDDRGAIHQDAAIDSLARSGQHVLAVDVRGTGVLGPRAGSSGYGADYQFAARAWLLGTSVVTWQVHDIHASLAVLDALVPGGAPEVTIHARGQTVPAAVFAAQHLRPAGLVLEEGPVSYEDVASSDTHAGLTLAVMPGVLQVTDLPELVARLAPVPVRLVRPRAPDGGAIAAADVGRRFGSAILGNVTIDAPR
ncbi:xylan esterase [Luteitalea sp. TBR-22]|uniref:alpha/beta hydrolase family protein n=1 Tax=Luteitalea sp. TBR-22 TaxID=2802971 RepID=UPI001AF0BC6E|nr:acetylxylan esterase [Luteitalea sp. TBR-22]BCS33275.1 xylan esterase [Luteitalea sp. TBR-22]